MHNHFVYLVVTDKEILIRDGSVGTRVAIECVSTRRPKVCAHNMQVLNFFCVARVKFEKFFASLCYTFDLRSYGNENCSLVI